MTFNITLLPGDGIGPEVTREVVRVLEKIGTVYNHQFIFDTQLIGGAAIDAKGDPLPEETVTSCASADAIFLGAIGGPKWDDPNAKVRPEQGILRIRKALNVFANLRPVTVYPQLFEKSPLKSHLLDGVDIMVVRELTGGIYFGEKTRGDRFAIDECKYTIEEIERITEVACKLAMKRKKLVTSVDKANVLETSRLWRDTVEKYVAKHYPEITLEHQLVDSASMKLIQQPAHFDVLLTENMFGDILTDEASVLAGSMGLLPSASLGENNVGLYEPIHGSAPDIAGKGIANPYASILSAAMMLHQSLNLAEEANVIESAVLNAISAGAFTPDLDSSSPKSTSEVTDVVLSYI